jgi:hypothetical protein
MQSGRAAQSAPGAVTACHVFGVELLIFGLVVAEQAAKRHLR